MKTAGFDSTAVTLPGKVAETPCDIGVVTLGQCQRHHTTSVEVSTLVPKRLAAVDRYFQSLGAIQYSIKYRIQYRRRAVIPCVY